MMMKRFAAAFILLLLSFGFVPASITAAPAPLITLDGQPLSFDVPPSNENGTVLVPVRAIFEALGASVIWDEATQTVTAVKSGTEIKLSVGQNMAYSNGAPVALTIPPQVVADRVLVPLRFVSEAFGAEVNWIAEKQEIALKVAPPPSSSVTPPLNQGPNSAGTANQTQPELPTPAAPKSSSDNMLLFYQYVQSHWPMLLLVIGSLILIVWAAPLLRRSGNRPAEQPEETHETPEALYQQGLMLIQQAKWAEANLILISLGLDKYQDSEPLSNYAVAQQKYRESNDPEAVDPYWAAYMADFYCRKIPDIYEGIYKDEIVAFKAVCRDNLAVWEQDEAAVKKHEKAEEQRQQLQLNQREAENS